MTDQFGAVLRQIRTDRKLSLRQLGRLAHIDFSLIAKIERSRRAPTVAIARALDDALGAQSELIDLAEAQRPNLPIRAVTADPVGRVGRLDLEPGLRFESPRTPPRDRGEVDGASDWPVWFGVRLAQLIAVVYDWHGSPAEPDVIQALLHQEIQMFDAIAPANSPATHNVSRRQALMTLAALPLTFGVPDGRTPQANAEFFLSRCAASLTACWHLLGGADLDAAHHVLQTYLVGLERTAQRSSKYQQAAARLASQGHRICGIVALHRNQLQVREHHCRQAMYYASIASDAASTVSALISHASTYFYRNDPRNAVALYEQALALESAAAPLQRSRVQAELSVVYAQVGREQDALRSVESAEELYPDRPELDPSFLYAEFTRASLALEQGLAFIALSEQSHDRDYAQRAIAIFQRVEEAVPGSTPDRIRYEITNHQARAAVLLNDIDLFETYASRSIEGIILLGSRQRLKELRGAWHHANRQWPSERRLKTANARLRSAMLQISAGED